MFAFIYRRLMNGREISDPTQAETFPQSRQGEDMTSLEAAARFAAFTWYTECRRDPSNAIQVEANRFASENWQSFIPVANDGWGRLLLRLGKTGKEGGQRPPEASRSIKRQLAAAG